MPLPTRPQRHFDPASLVRCVLANLLESKSDWSDVKPFKALFTHKDDAFNCAVGLVHL